MRPLRRPTYAFLLLFFLLLMMNAGQEKPLLSTEIFGITTAFAATIAAFVFLTIAMRREDLSTAYPAAAASAFAFVYIALPLAMLVQLRQQWAGAFLILYLLFLVWAGDILAYFVGRSIGRHLMAPRISPKKTWEGAVASMVASLGVGSALFYYATPLCTTLLQWGLIQRRDGIFSLEQTCTAPGANPHSRPERSCPIGRSGGITDQTRRRGQRFRHHSPRARRHVGSYRRSALRRASSVVLCGLAGDAVVKARRTSLRGIATQRQFNICSYLQFLWKFIVKRKVWRMAPLGS